MVKTLEEIQRIYNKLVQNKKDISPEEFSEFIKNTSSLQELKYNLEFNIEKTLKFVLEYTKILKNDAEVIDALKVFRKNLRKKYGVWNKKNLEKQNLEKQKKLSKKNFLLYNTIHLLLEKEYEDYQYMRLVRSIFYMFLLNEHDKLTQIVEAINNSTKGPMDKFVQKSAKKSKEIRLPTQDQLIDKIVSDIFYSNSQPWLEMFKFKDAGVFKKHSIKIFNKILHYLDSKSGDVSYLIKEQTFWDLVNLLYKNIRDIDKAAETLISYLQNNQNKNKNKILMHLGERIKKHLKDSKVTNELNELIFQISEITPEQVDRLIIELGEATAKTVKETKKLTVTSIKAFKVITKKPHVTSPERLIKIYEAWKNLKSDPIRYHLLNGRTKTIERNKDDIRFVEIQKIRDIYEEKSKKNGHIALALAKRKFAVQDPYFVNDLAEARWCFGFAAKEGVPEAFGQYAEMCINGIGGNVDLEQAKNSLNYFIKFIKSKIDNPTLNTKIYCLMGEVCFYNNNFAEAMKYFYKAAKSGNKEATFFCFMLKQDDSKLQLPGILDNNWVAECEMPAKKSQMFPSKTEDNERDYDHYYATINALKQKDAKSLKDLYSKRYGEDAEWYLLTTLCYEAIRHTWEDSNCVTMRDALVLFDVEKYNFEMSREDFERILRQHEIDTKDYYGEYLSDDSDDEEVENEWNSPKEIQAKSALVNKIHNEILKSHLENFGELLNKVSTEAEQHDEQYFLDEFKKIFTNDIPGINAKAKKNKKVIKDLELINYYASRGKLHEALPQIVTKFRIMQRRGIGYKLKPVSKPERDLHWKILKDLRRNGKFSNIGLYSKQVYKRANITLGMEQTDYDRFKLKKWGELLLRNLRGLLLYSSGYSQNLPKFYQGKNLNNYIQGKYSSDYSGFHNMLSSTELNPKLREILGQHKNSFFVSTGDVGSYHSYRYSYNNKVYGSDENSKKMRLRPRYKKRDPEGFIRAERPHSGVTYITLHHLKDFIEDPVYKKSNHVPSMKNLGQLRLINNIVYELETSFFSYINEGNVVAIHLNKYPSFQNLERYKREKKYQDFYKHKYGITKDIYEKLYKLFTYGPHSPQRRIAKLLLGEYLSVFFDIYGFKQGQRIIEKEGAVLLFRNIWGDFSLTPIASATLETSGNSYEQRLQRHFAKKRRENPSRDMKTFTFYEENDKDNKRRDLFGGSDKNGDEFTTIPLPKEGFQEMPNQQLDMQDTSTQKIKIPILQELGTSIEDTFTSPQRQLGYNCGDIAMDVKRERLVQDLLDPPEKANKNILRNLLAPEIAQAAINTMTFHDGTHSEETQILPNSMRNDEILMQLAKQYQALDSTKPMLQLIRKCNDKLGCKEGNRKSLQELADYFTDIGNTQNDQEAHQIFKRAWKMSVKSKTNLINYCVKEKIYKQYVKDYYGSKKWMVHSSTCGGTTIFDATAYLYSFTVHIYQRRNGKLIREYTTARYGLTEKHVCYNGVNHFYRIDPPQEFENKTIEAIPSKNITLQKRKRSHAKIEGEPPAKKRKLKPKSNAEPKPSAKRQESLSPIPPIQTASNTLRTRSTLFQPADPPQLTTIFTISPNVIQPTLNDKELNEKKRKRDEVFDPVHQEELEENSRTNKKRKLQK